jgi:hypothetical protein
MSMLFPTRGFVDVPKSVSNFSIGRDSFDAQLSPGYNFNLDLAITLKVWLIQETGDDQRVVKDTDGQAFQTEPWPSDEWRKFRETYQAEGEKFWDNRFWLQHKDFPTWEGLDYPYSRGQGSYSNHTFPVPSFAHVPLQTPSTCTTSQLIPDSGLARPAINCRFRLQVVSHLEPRHTGVRVAYLKRVEGAPQDRFRAHSRLNSQQDLEVVTQTLKTGDGQHIRLRQRPFLHEIGHLMGQPHAGQATPFEQAAPACATQMAKNPQNGSNSDPCYGVTEDALANIMGGGEVLSPRNALPWQMVMAHLTRTSPAAWPVSMRSVAAQVRPPRPLGRW